MLKLVIGYLTSGYYRYAEFPKIEDVDVFFLFFKGADTLSRKKEMSENHLKVDLHCILEPYNANRLPILQLYANWVKVVTYMYARSPAHHVAHGHCKCTASLYGYMGKLQSAITVTLRCESKF